jgi:ABC-type amino acid transport substrate-binding protein
MMAVVLCILGFVGYFFYKKNSSMRTRDEFVVGMTGGYAPFVSVNEQGEYEGFDIDVARLLAQKMGKKLVLKDLGSMVSLFLALDMGKIDAIIWGLSITQERLEKVIMIPYQGEVLTSYPLLFWNQIPASVSSIEDMNNKVVCVEQGSAQDSVLSKYDFITRFPVEKVDDALLNIEYGKADAAFVEPAIAKKFKNKYPEIQILEVPLAPQDQVHGVGITLKKDSTVLAGKVEQALEQSKDEIKTFEEKWGL